MAGLGIGARPFGYQYMQRAPGFLEKAAETGMKAGAMYAGGGF
jgi:hypothetical protein